MEKFRCSFERVRKRLSHELAHHVRADFAVRFDTMVSETSVLNQKNKESCAS